jgi:hypothetical protein
MAYFGYVSDASLEESPVTMLSHDLIAFKSLDGFVAVRKGSLAEVRLPMNFETCLLFHN